MPSAKVGAREIIATIGDFERSVEAAESALVVRDWPRIDALLSDQRRLTHALQNALDETRDERPQAFTDEFNRRIERIVERRADQLRRLIAFNHLVNARLTMISRSRPLRRAGAQSTPAPRILDSRQ